MALTRKIALYLLVVLMGLNGGLHFIGILAPVETKMTAAQFAPYWQITDGYMGQKMPIFALITLSLFLTNLILLRKTWRSLLFWLIVGSGILFIADGIFAGTEQLPINKYMQSIDVNNLTTEQLEKIDPMRLATLKNFDLRNYMAVVVWLAMCVCPFLLPKLEERLKIEN
jgi:hypothetical protein